MDNFQGNVEIFSQDDTSKTVVIDRVFKITTISDRILQKSREVWSELQKSTKIIFIATLIGGLAGIAAAVALGVLNPALLIPAIAVGVVALSFFAFSFLALKRSHDAGNELKKWEDPINQFN